jgi:serine/threonine protein kinase
MSKILGYLVGQAGQWSGARFAIPRNGVIFGRDPEQAGHVIDHPLVSRRHAQVVIGEDRRAYLIDLKSRNGTYLAGRRLTAPVALSAGDRIDFGGEGKVLFVFRPADAPSVSGAVERPFGDNSTRVEWKVGDLIGRKLEVRGVLGKGGFGVVYLVLDNETGELSALKTFRHELLSDGSAKDAFKREALLWVNLDAHPFIVRARFVDFWSGRLFVKMDYVAPDNEGRVSLAHHLALHPLDTNQTLEWAVQFCLGMEHAVNHGIKCHRDIKPANILITREGSLKITDFGLAAAAEMAWRASAAQGHGVGGGSVEERFSFSVLRVGGGVRCGTPGYMPPEVYRGETADIRSDVYSFGLVLWQMATGSRTPPFVGPCLGDMEAFLAETYERQIAGHAPRIGPPLWPLVERCLREKPGERYRDFGELRDELETILRKRTGQTVPLPEVTEQGVAFWGNKGASLNALRRYEDAIRCHDKALAIDPHHPIVWHNKGVALYGLGQQNEAIVCYDKALAINPQYANAWNSKGVCLGVLKRHGEAIDCYLKAVGIDPRFAEAWGGMGHALHRLGRNEEALACFNKLLAIVPQNAGAWYEKGSVLEALGRQKEGFACQDKALALDPHLEEWRYL